jgi:hypothetical protein
VKTDNLVRRWEALSAQRESQGELPLAEQQDLDRLTEQMKFVFDESFEEIVHA